MVKFTVIVLNVTFLCVSFLFSKDLFNIYDLKYQGEFLAYHVNDLNNDQLKDILILQKQHNLEKQKEHWLSVYFQNEEGFSPSPVQHFKLPGQIIAFDIGDVSGDARKELVYFSRNGLSYYSPTDSGFTLTSSRLIESSSLFMLPGDYASFSFDFVRDVNADGVDDLLVPDVRHFDFYFRKQANASWQRNRIPLLPESSYSGFYNSRYSVGHRVNAVYSVPYLTFADFNSDSRDDVIAVYRDSLVVHLLKEDGLFDQEPLCRLPINFGEIWRGGKIQRTRWGDDSIKKHLMRLVDLDGDGLLDAVVVQKSTRKSIMRPATDVRIHFGRTDRSNSPASLYFLDEPDQIVRPGGTQLILDILDFNKDGRSDLLLPVVKVGLGNIIRVLLTKNIKIQAETYFLGEDRKYPQSPDQVNELMVSFTYRGGATSPVYELADFNADGLLDILGSIKENTLVFVHGKQNSGFKKNIGNRFHVPLPQNGERVGAINLNRDKKADIVINYAESNPRIKELKKVLRILLAN